MKRLYVLRHAKSSWATPGLSDIDRPLNERGRRQLELLSQWWIDHDMQVDHVAISPAKRTQETLSRFEAALQPKTTSIEQQLYPGTLDTYLATIWGQTANSIMLIGHNPTCDELARVLAAPSSPAIGELAAHFPTAGLAIFDFAGESWSDVGTASCQLVDFIRVRALEAKLV